jgi:hypothetical protein
MRVVTHFSPFQTPMIATSHEEISGTSDVMDEPIVRVTHHGHVDPPIQEEIQGVQTGDLTPIDQLEEIESQLLETPLVEQIVEVGRLMEHALPESACNDEDALFNNQDDHSMCLDTAIWDPGVDDSSKLSAQEDIAAHTRYSMTHRELAVEDDVQLRMGRPSGIVDSRQSNTLSFAESVVSDGISSEWHEGVPQHDHDQEPHHLAAQLRASEAMIMVAARHIDDMQALMDDCCWRASMAHDSLDEAFSIGDFHTLLERMSVMRSDFQKLLTDRDYLLVMSEMYYRALREQVLEMVRLTQELGSTRGFLGGTQTTPQE